LKYAEDEKTVRELAKDYFGIFTQKQYTQSAHSLFIYAMIFDAKISGKKAPPSTKIKLNETCLRASGVSK
jgi:hypothetical protein